MTSFHSQGGAATTGWDGTRAGPQDGLGRDLTTGSGPINQACHSQACAGPHLCMAHFSMKVLPQPGSGHSNGFSPVCVRVCLRTWKQPTSISRKSEIG